MYNTFSYPDKEKQLSISLLFLRKISTHGTQIFNDSFNRFVFNWLSR